MTTEGIEEKLRRAERVLNGDSEYDGADAARIIRGLCTVWLDERKTTAEALKHYLWFLERGIQTANAQYDSKTLNELEPKLARVKALLDC